MDKDERIMIHGSLAAIIETLIDKKIITNEELNQKIKNAEKETIAALEEGKLPK